MDQEDDDIGPRGLVIDAIDLENVMREVGSDQETRTPMEVPDPLSSSPVKDNIQQYTTDYLKGKLTLAEYTSLVEDGNNGSTSASVAEKIVAIPSVREINENKTKSRNNSRKSNNKDQMSVKVNNSKKKTVQPKKTKQVTFAKKTKAIEYKINDDDNGNGGGRADSDSDTELNEFEQKTVEEILKKAFVNSAEINMPDKELQEEFHKNQDFYKSGDSTKEFQIIRRKKLPPTLQALIGEAHLRCARQDYESAIGICNEIIKEQPTYVEPFSTLAMIYDNLDDTEKSLQYSLIAAFLDPKRCNEWPRLGEMYVEKNILPHAIYCYTKAISQEPKNIQLHLRRSEIFEKSEDYRNALRSYVKTLALNPNEPNLCVTILKKQASLYYKIGDYENAYDTLNKTLKEYPKFVTFVEINLYVELAIQLQSYVEALDVFIKFGHIDFSPSIEASAFESTETLMDSLSSKNELRCRIPKLFPIDLMGKLAIVLIHLEAFSIAQILTDRLQLYPVKDYGDLYLEVGEAYMTQRRLDSALSLFKSLIESESFSHALSWLRFAECHYLKCNFSEAAKAYETVVSLAPKYTVAKSNLSYILEKLGRSEDALVTLQDSTEDLVDRDLLIQRCDILIKKNRSAELYETISKLFSRHSFNLFNFKDCKELLYYSNKGKRFGAIMLEREKESINIENHHLLPNPMKKPFGLEAEWIAYINLFKLLQAYGRWDLLNRLSYTALGSRFFAMDEFKELACELYSFYSAIFSSNTHLIPFHIRLHNTKALRGTLLVNLLSLSTRICLPARFSRQVQRLIVKFPGNHNLALIACNISFVNGQYRYAISEYSSIYEVSPKNALLPLMLASCSIQLLCQKTITCRSDMSLLVLAYLDRYRGLRGETQETYYNIGRTYHIMGLYHLAIIAYERVFELPPARVINTETTLLFDENCLDLKCEAAYNLVHLYKSHGKYAKARYYLSNYLRI